MYSINHAREYVNRCFGSLSVEKILIAIINDSWELSRDKIDVQRLNHKAMTELALEKLKR